MRMAMTILLGLTSVAHADGLTPRERMTIRLPGREPVLVDDTDTLVALARDVKRGPAAAKDCARQNVKHAAWLAARLEPPHADDPVLVIETSTVPWAVMASVAQLDVPVAIAVRDASGAERVLGVRWCARSSPPPSEVVSGIDIVSTTDGVVVGPSGGGDRARVSRSTGALESQRLAESIRAQAEGRPIATVRLGIDSYAPVDLPVVLAAALETGPRAIALVPALTGGPALVAALGNTTTDGTVDKGAARSAMQGRIDDLGACVHRLAFAEPKLAGTYRLAFAVAADGTLRPTTKKPSAFARCAGDVLAKATLVGSEPGAFGVTIVVAPNGPWSITPQPSRGLTGSGF